MQSNYVHVNFMMKSPSPDEMHIGVSFTSQLKNYDGGNGDMEVHTAHIRHQFQVSEDLERKLHISGIRSNFKISPLFLVTKLNHMSNIQS